MLQESEVSHKFWLVQVRGKHDKQRDVARDRARRLCGPGSVDTSTEALMSIAPICILQLRYGEPRDHGWPTGMDS